MRGLDRWETLWAPVRIGWTDVGVPTVTARFRIVGKQFFFQVRVVPSTTVATAAGTSYIVSAINMAGLGGDGNMVDSTTLIAIGACAFDIPNSRIYVPSQVATGDIITIAGWHEIM